MQEDPLCTVLCTDASAVAAYRAHLARPGAPVERDVFVLSPFIRVDCFCVRVALPSAAAGRVFSARVREAAASAGLPPPRYDKSASEWVAGRAYFAMMNTAALAATHHRIACPLRVADTCSGIELSLTGLALQRDNDHRRRFDAYVSAHPNAGKHRRRRSLRQS